MIELIAYWKSSKIIDQLKGPKCVHSETNGKAVNLAG